MGMCGVHSETVKQARALSAWLTFTARRLSTNSRSGIRICCQCGSEVHRTGDQLPAHSTGHRRYVAAAEGADKTQHTLRWKGRFERQM